MARHCPVYGGTDGGNKRTIIHNARRLSEAKQVKNIIVAGNKSARDEIRDILAGSHKNVIFTKNVMPEFGRLELSLLTKKSGSFINRITEAKGIPGR